MDRISREEILKRLQVFARDVGRPPKQNEPDFASLKYVIKKEFGSWEHALRIAGLQTYEVWRGKRTLIGIIRMSLDHNPLTLTEIRDKLSEYPVSTSKQQSMSSTRICSAIRRSSDIRSIGPVRTRIYYLEGQETLAQKRLDSIMSEIPPMEEEIFYQLRQPMTLTQIEKHILGDELTGRRKDELRRYLKELELARLIYRARFTGHVGVCGSEGRLISSELFGDLAGKTYYCRFDCPNEVAHLIRGYIPRVESAIKTRVIWIASARSRSLRRILPEDVCRILDKVLWEGVSN